MSSILVAKQPQQRTSAVPERSRPKTSPTPPSPFDDEDYKDEIVSSFESKDTDIVMILRNPTYTMSQKRMLAAANSGGALRRFYGTKRSGGATSEYILRIVTAGAVTPTAGVAASSFLVDPSNIPLSEWTTWAALFDEVKVASFSVTIAPYSNGTTSSGTNSRLTSIAMGSFYSKTSIPSNIVNVLMSDDAELVSPLMVVPHTHRYRVPKLGFAPTSSPGGTSFYGCPGSVQLYATGDGTNSMLTYFVCGHYHLRGRL